MEKSKFYNGMHCFFLHGTRHIELLGFEAHSRGSWATDPVTLCNKLIATNGNIKVSNLKINYYKQTCAVCKRKIARE